MRKILIISYHSLPLDVIASYRAMAYLRHFKKHGFEPTLLTHPWQDQPNSYFEEIYPYGNIIRLPFKFKKQSKFKSFLKRLPIVNKLSILVRWARGILDDREEDWLSYECLRVFTFKYLESNKYDVLMGIFSPHHHLRLCKELNDAYGIPYVLDFRDLWHNRVIHNAYKPNLKERLHDYFCKFYWKKWLRNALFFTITSKEWKNKIAEFTSTQGFIITNGFDPELFERVQKCPGSNNFEVIHAGSLYSHQQLDIFLKGCSLFINTYQPSNFKVRFIGGDRRFKETRLAGYMANAKDYIYNYLDKDHCEVSKRVPKNELVSEIFKCQLLLFPGLPNTPGTHLGKIFDYLGSGKNILMVPDDNSVVGKLIQETNTGFIANTSEDVADYLMQAYSHWRESGDLGYRGKREVIAKYTREHQVGEMAKHLKSHL